MADIVGTQGDDTINAASLGGLDNATAGTDNIYGLNGNDIIRGSAAPTTSTAAMATTP